MLASANSMKNLLLALQPDGALAFDRPRACGGPPILGDRAEPDSDAPALAHDRQPALPDQAIHRVNIQVAERGGGLMDIQEVVRPDGAFVLAASEGADQGATRSWAGRVFPVKCRLGLTERPLEPHNILGLHGYVRCILR